MICDAQKDVVDSSSLSISNTKDFEVVLIDGVQCVSLVADYFRVISLFYDISLWFEGWLLKLWFYACIFGGMGNH